MGRKNTYRVGAPEEAPEHAGVGGGDTEVLVQEGGEEVVGLFLALWVLGWGHESVLRSAWFARFHDDECIEKCLL
jgi:hypothetical protein